MEDQRVCLMELVSGCVGKYSLPISLEWGESKGVLSGGIFLHYQYAGRLGKNTGARRNNLLLGEVVWKDGLVAGDVFSHVMPLCQSQFPHFCLGQTPHSKNDGDLIFFDNSGKRIEFVSENPREIVLQAVNFFFSLNLFYLSRLAYREAVKRGYLGKRPKPQQHIEGELVAVVGCLGELQIPEMLTIADETTILSYCRLFH